jgi:aspartate 1-decarboxylase
MILNMLKAKIHRATVTESDLHYEGSITIDPLLLEASGILPFEQVDVLNITNGHRFTTYAIKADEKGKGDIKVNGAAARLVQKGDLVIICAFAGITNDAAYKHQPKIIMVDANNKQK